MKQLSFAEKEELYKLLIRDRRREIRENAEVGLEEYRRGELKSYSDIYELMHSGSEQH